MTAVHVWILRDTGQKVAAFLTPSDKNTGGFSEAEHVAVPVAEYEAHEAYVKRLEKAVLTAYDDGVECLFCCGDISLAEGEEHLPECIVVEIQKEEDE